VNKIETTLLEIGVPANQLGFGYLADGIELAISDPAYMHNTTTMLYRKVAQINNTTPSRVERGMCHSIETAFQRCGAEAINGYFGSSIFPIQGKPTNSVFIAVMTLALKEDKAE